LASLAAELAPEGDFARRWSLAEEALSIARRCGDPATLLACAQPALHAILVPETVRERLVATEEAEALALQLGDRVAQFWASGFRATTALEIGDVAEVDRCLGQATARAEELGQPTLAWVNSFTRSWRALLAGDAELAESLASQALQLGAKTGQLDAVAFYGVQVLAVRWHQGRLGELVPFVAQALADNPGSRLSSGSCVLPR